MISDNQNAITLYEKLGFQKYGTFPDNMKYADGHYASADWMMKNYKITKTALIFNEIHPVLLSIPGGFSISAIYNNVKNNCKGGKNMKVIHRQYQMDHSCACGFVSCYLYVQWN